MKYQAIRQAIKELAFQQVELKPQRKTVNFKGVRKVPAYDAAIQHDRNRFKLRHMYMAYAKLRGIERPVPTKGIYYPSDVDAYVTKFTEIEEQKAS